ncbi:MAG: Glyoxalase/bleomycin resistance protein/dioxygenase [Actinomycetia bacterium]|nr:Glyoxalase/bleomycin resistance protein/dioxygenase [Actinomycetes bacterium]
MWGPGDRGRRARALVRGGGGATGPQNADFWAAKASEILRCYLLAAALDGWDGAGHGLGAAPAGAGPGRAAVPVRHQRAGRVARHGSSRTCPRRPTPARATSLRSPRRSRSWTTRPWLSVLGLGTKPAMVRFEPGWRRRRRLIPGPPVRRPVETERGAPVTLTAVPDQVDPADGRRLCRPGSGGVVGSPAQTNDGRPKRWVVVRPRHAETGLLLARADGEHHRAAVGNQFAGRVGFFLEVDDFDATHRRIERGGSRVPDRAAR